MKVTAIVTPSITIPTKLSPLPLVIDTNAPKNTIIKVEGYIVIILHKAHENILLSTIHRAKDS